MSYDHLFRAGNRADIIKHTALSAVLSDLVPAARRASKPFTYVDTFCGYAASPLMEGIGWQDGLGRILNANPSERASVAWLEWFCDTYFRHGLNPSVDAGGSAIRGIYPGSAMIVADFCRQQKVNAQLRLFDISLAVVASIQGLLRNHDFVAGDALVSKIETIMNATPATPHNPLLQGSDLVLVDPPGVRGPFYREAPTFDELFAQMSCHSSSVLFWLPVMGVEPTDRQSGEHHGEAVESQNWRIEALKRDQAMRATVVQWRQTGRGMLGCQLIYRLPEPTVSKLRSTIEGICALAAWRNGTNVTNKACQHL